MAGETFHVRINQEGTAGAIRGKIPTSMVNAMGAEPGDIITIEVNKKNIVGGKLLTSREAAKYESALGNGRASKPKAKKGKVKASTSTVKPKVKGKVKKSAKRKTRVEYDEPVKPKVKKKLKLKKKLRK